MPLLAARNRMKFGFNMGRWTYWSPAYPATNWIKHAKDQNGDGSVWICAAPPGGATDIRIPQGTAGNPWVLKWTGAGTATMGGPATLEASSANRNEYSTPNSVSNNWSCNVTGSVSNLALIPPGQEANYDAGDHVSSDFLSDIQGVSIVRFMDWMDTNQPAGSNKIVNYGDYTTTAAETYFGNEVPLAVCAEVCNRLGADFWFNCPHSATMACLNSMISEIDGLLDPQLKIWVEYSNEVWNSGAAFRGQYNYQVEGLDPVPEGEYESGTATSRHRMTAWHTKLVWDEAVSAAGRDRIVKVGGGWWNMNGGENGAGVWRTGLMASVTQYRQQVDCLAFAPYFDLNLTDPPKVGWGTKAFPLELMYLPSDRATKNTQYADHRGYHVTEHGQAVSVVAYECGDHMTPGWTTEEAERYHEFFRDPYYGKQAITHHFEMLRAAGFSTACDFSSHSTWLDDGSQWGAMEYQGHTTSPSYQGVKVFLDRGGV